MQNNKNSKPLEVLTYLGITNLIENLPNVAVSLRILLAIPVILAIGERSFSKLKLMKCYLWSTMFPDRLTDLPPLSTIEHDCVQRYIYMFLFNI
nr:unnamed protein product [Callosobruchus analis]